MVLVLLLLFFFFKLFLFSFVCFLHWNWIWINISEILCCGYLCWKIPIAGRSSVRSSLVFGGNTESWREVGDEKKKLECEIRTLLRKSRARFQRLCSFNCGFRWVHFDRLKLSRMSQVGGIYEVLDHRFIELPWESVALKVKVSLRRELEGGRRRESIYPPPLLRFLRKWNC